MLPITHVRVGTEVSNRSTSYVCVVLARARRTPFERIVAILLTDARRAGTRARAKALATLDFMVHFLQ